MSLFQDLTVWFLVLNPSRLLDSLELRAEQVTGNSEEEQDGPQYGSSWDVEVVHQGE